jgi:hypothetical protein
MFEAGAGMVKVQKRELSWSKPGLSQTCRIGGRHTESCKSTGIEGGKFVKAVPERTVNLGCTDGLLAIAKVAVVIADARDEQLGKED